jgi:predicted DsbA family dithiol-disulfide isomerase
MQIDAVYDFLCPWCFVGKRHLDLAIAQEQPENLTISWHQFMLYPHFDRGGHDFLAFFKSKYGETLRVPMWDAIRAVAEPVGIHFRFEDMTRGPASIDGHRLVRFAGAQKPGIEAVLIEHISSAFFEKAQIIDDSFLFETAEVFGIDRAGFAKLLTTEDDIEALQNETREWHAKGVKSMPHYIFDQGREVVTQTSVALFKELLGKNI